MDHYSLPLTIKAPIFTNVTLVSPGQLFLSGYFPSPQSGYTLRLISNSRHRNEEGIKLLWCSPDTTAQEVENKISEILTSHMNGALWGNDNGGTRLDTGITSRPNWKYLKNVSYDPIYHPNIQQLGLPPASNCAQGEYGSVLVNGGGISNLDVKRDGTFTQQATYQCADPGINFGGGGG